MLRKLLKIWVRDKEASTAIEFSLLFIPYMMLTLAIIELAMMYTAASLLEGATNSAARLIKTGQVQQSQTMQPEEMFAAAICEYADVLIQCDEIVMEVIPLTSFTDYSELEPQYDEDGNMVSQGFDAGGSDDRVLIRTSYRYEMITPLIGELLAGPSGKRTFISTLVLQSEPYEFEES
ncbi:MAG: TadE/TadG family type IV pilus assembly protein [Alphaproteobacteria bacterium]